MQAWRRALPTSLRTRRRSLLSRHRPPPWAGASAASASEARRPGNEIADLCSSDLDPYGCYKLNKWPQPEREYPLHFRIATAMMKGPATLAEIAGASGMPVADVADFVNASLATGFADIAPNTPPEPAEPAKPTGLFGRLRGK